MQEKQVELQKAMEAAVLAKEYAERIKAAEDRDAILKWQEKQIASLEAQLAEKNAIIEDELKMATKKWDKYFDG